MLEKCRNKTFSSLYILNVPIYSFIYPIYTEHKQNNISKKDRIQSKNLTTLLKTIVIWKLIRWFEFYLLLLKRKKNSLLEDSAECLCGWLFFSLFWVKVLPLVRETSSKSVSSLLTGLVWNQWERMYTIKKQNMTFSECSSHYSQINKPALSNNLLQNDPTILYCCPFWTNALCQSILVNGRRS